MQNTFQEFTEKLGKLQRNESQMTERQKVVYAAQLKSLRSKVAALASEIARGFIIGGIQILKADPPETRDRLTSKVAAIINQEKAAGTIKAASRVLFSAYDTDKFLEALIPLHDRVWFEGYAPYWCQHCRPYTGIGASGQKLTHWNDIIGMGWNPERGLWEKESEICWTVMLPPTMELAATEYEKERCKHENKTDFI